MHEMIRLLPACGIPETSFVVHISRVGRTVILQTLVDELEEAETVGPVLLRSEPAMQHRTVDRITL